MRQRVFVGLDAAALALATLLAAGRVAGTPSWTADDAFIVARYAEHLGRHGELVFNLGGARVEGFTGFLLVLAESLGVVAHVPPETVGRYLGYVAFFASAPLLFGIGRELRFAFPTTGLCGLLYFGVAEHVTHVGSGLETEMYLACTLGSVLAFLRALRPEHPRFLGLAISASVLSMVRPEGGVVSLLLLALTFWRHRSDRTMSRELLAASLRGYVLPTVSVNVAALAYYGSLVPNTFQAKRAESWTITFLHDVATLVDAYFVVIVAGCVAALVVHRLIRASWARSGDPRPAWLGAASLVAIAVHALAYSRSDLVMNYGRRFAIHVLPWLVLAVGALVDHAIRALSNMWSEGRARLVVLGCLMVPGPYGRSVDELATQRRFVGDYARHLARAHLVVELLQRDLPAGATLACYPDAGFIPYATDLDTVDFGKLNDAYLAREAKTPADVASYFFSRAPTAAVFTVHADGSHFDAGADAILADPRFVAYREEARVLDDQGGGHVVYVRLTR